MIFGFYNREFVLDEETDFNENIKPILSRDKTVEAIPQFYNNYIIGWTIQPRYE